MDNNIIENYIEKIDKMETGNINKNTIINIDHYNNKNMKQKRIKKIHSETKKYKQCKHNKEVIYFEPIITKSYLENRDKIMKEGNKIYKENDYLAKIWDIMTDPNFSEFFDSYLTNYNDLQVAMVFFHVYKSIKSTYEKTFKTKITKEEMVYMLKQIMRNNFMRKYFIQDAKDNEKIQLKTDILLTDVQNVMLNYQKDKNNYTTNPLLLDNYYST